jgi:hypothetical protein
VASRAVLVVFFGSEDGGSTFLRNFGGLSTDHTAFTSQKIIFFVTAGVRTSDPTFSTLCRISQKPASLSKMSRVGRPENRD